MTLKSSEFPEAGENGVVQPNPEPLPGVDPATPRVFTVLRDRNDEAHPQAVAIDVRRPSGEYEDMGAAMHIYWEAGSARIKDVLGWPTNLHHEQDGSTIHFAWR
ncbi:hypothetical protein [Chondromyces apiculatus]|uniref:Uncharacterized protein n=1 Tax=Chondromyces apiculatus DSM 436 TaxID=1192034 RepID=A0A017SZ28_9BACT|nr:hypothetical protein [Chondromyces apiculatus]EYF02218.1 Hypothetical protein CAP_7290 [Chondromyces apiculatus DSM 436]